MVKYSRDEVHVHVFVVVDDVVVVGQGPVKWTSEVVTGCMFTWLLLLMFMFLTLL